MGSLFPQNTDSEDLYFIRSMFIFPIILSGIQVLLLTFVYPYDTPPMLKQRGEYTKLREFLFKIYKEDYVEGVILELGGEESSSEDAGTLTYGEIFLGPTYRRATWVGIGMSVFQ